MLECRNCARRSAGAFETLLEPKRLQRLFSLSCNYEPPPEDNKHPRTQGRGRTRPRDEEAQPAGRGAGATTPTRPGGGEETQQRPTHGGEGPLKQGGGNVLNNFRKRPNIKRNSDVGRRAGTHFKVTQSLAFQRHRRSQTSR